MEINRTIKIPVGNLTKKEADELINRLINEYRNNDFYSHIRELNRKELLKTRINKLNKLDEQNKK